MLTDPDLIPPRQELDRGGAHPAECRTGDDGVLGHVDEEELVSVSRVRQEDRPAVPERGQPIVVAVPPVGGAWNDLDTVHRAVSSVQPKDEREAQRDERW
jgi:hypothetical protein